MGKQAPSIFNDVLGPVMRGPSSSHAAGGFRIAKLIRQIVNGNIKRVLVEFDINGSLAESHDGHGTDMGFACGLLDIPLTDGRIDKFWDLIYERGIELEYRVSDYGAEHPNYYKVTIETSENRKVRVDAISTGGGMIEIISVNRYPVTIEGDYDEYCFMISQDEGEQEEIRTFLEEHIVNLECVLFSEKGSKYCVECKLSQPISSKEREQVEARYEVLGSFALEAVLPTRSTYVCQVPFKTAEEMMTYNEDKNLKLWELAAIYESVRGNTTKEAVIKQMGEVVDIMYQAVENGLAGTEYKDRILHSQAYRISMEENKDRLVPGNVMNTVIQYITAVMETKSSMGVFVAAPTAGSCGCLPGTILGLMDALGKSREEAVKGMMAAGLIGVFFAEQATFAAEVGGCQVECGAGSGMAAAGVAQMMGGTARECIDAASVALQGVTGLACDPVANRVEVPCLNKNVMGGTNALGSANMVLAGFDRVIPLDETIKAMYDIGLKLPLELRCTYGGLGKTKTSNAIRKRLEDM
ncbi:MAG: L-serine ammonia-lyase, iron-sulfur-dependent, subunit alpha [Dorea sp.]